MIKCEIVSFSANQLDLPSAQPQEVMAQVEEELALEGESCLCVSAKTGKGVSALLEAIVERIPPPEDRSQEPLQALIFDSWFDAYLGAVSLCRIVAGSLAQKDPVQMMSTGKKFEALKLAKLCPKPQPVSSLGCGEVGFVAGSLKSVSQIRVGDTLTSSLKPAPSPLPGFSHVKQMVFGGVFPLDAGDYPLLKDSLEKLTLNDASLSFEKESSNALGFGFRVGFLGLLHMEIVQERLEREYGLDLIFTAPSVIYELDHVDGSLWKVENPSKLPDVTEIRELREPYVLVTVHSPQTYLGAILKHLQERRGFQRALDYGSSQRVSLVYEVPMNEIIFDFHDKLKSLSRGYASMDYEFLEYRAGDLVKMEILVNGASVDALACILHRNNAAMRGRLLCKKLKEFLKRHMFQIAIQAAIGSKIVARETLSALRKDVTAKCYGGDISRKRKLLEKQKEGKKRMKSVGNVEIPQKAFTAILSLED